MSTCDHIVRMAAYNEVMNEKLYSAAGQLSQEELFADRKAFFGSLFGTMNHLVVADTIWLKRFCGHPARQPALDAIRAAAAPAALNQPQAEDLTGLLRLRHTLDQTIQRWAADLTPDDLEQPLGYANMKGMVSRKRYSSLIMHFFNHQTHHRGQATTLLSQSSIDIGATDLLMLIPNED
ncbi:damage-inducible protein DinB [Janthinobacterium sp. BJB301]|uniref:DinB family protein n=3 Tax=Oxalobacteraceae TaxID=75682 RepID=A0AAJ4T4B9_9BURK|nr:MULTISPECIES: DinB family protein [Janthinobacterium]KAB0326219.1 DUF664 domain-containing protein [Janthinobacterium lividum]PHV48497.1 damage-inducible protein DinB [Janthinobacterium sp. BJB301]QSX95346.1 DinB family protein [Janthinobacterium lividum]UGQ35181.1 DinB family protein [Janthinobacterium sp. PLB04]